MENIVYNRGECYFSQYTLRGWDMGFDLLEIKVVIDDGEQVLTAVDCRPTVTGVVMDEIVHAWRVRRN